MLGYGEVLTLLDAGRPWSVVGILMWLIFIFGAYLFYSLLKAAATKFI